MKRIFIKSFTFIALLFMAINSFAEIQVGSTQNFIPIRTPFFYILMPAWIGSRPTHESEYGYDVYNYVFGPKGADVYHEIRITIFKKSILDDNIFNKNDAIETRLTRLATMQLNVAVKSLIKNNLIEPTEVSEPVLAQTPQIFTLQSMTFAMVSVPFNTEKPNTGQINIFVTSNRKYYYVVKLMEFSKTGGRASSDYSMSTLMTSFKTLVITDPNRL